MKVTCGKYKWRCKKRMEKEVVLRAHNGKVWIYEGNAIGMGGNGSRMKILKRKSFRTRLLTIA